MVNKATFYSAIAKDASFQHEQELRLIYAPSIIPAAADTGEGPRALGPVRQLKWRASTYGVTPYFEFPIPNGAIREIWIGPANPEHKDRASRHLLSALLQYHGAGDAQLIESSSTYR
ncbi:hypothetical protein LGN13_23595 [Burkholderia multivorans]|uniref:hypothetical protein n=1 Tax=Burkholderia multivorans TaxID=87883 RepID=UPI00112401E3|nr:hypothetical protein [Burkholderia multivorans]MCA8504685.1 hypothetical protein [Burkholderia multivorans]MDN8083275.1 hypothetical protein [Burkholderia multivorans]